MRTFIVGLLLLITFGCGVDSATEAGKYWVVIDDPPKGLTWRQGPIDDPFVVQGDDQLHRMDDAITQDRNGFIRLFGEPILLEGERCKMPPVYTVKYLSADMTRKDAPVVVFSWKHTEGYGPGDVIPDKAMPDWLRPDVKQ